MKTCSRCGIPNHDEHRFCQQCGRPLAPPPPADATVHWSGTAVRPAGDVRRAVPAEKLFLTKKRLVIGRAPDCDVCLPHPTVSRYHALLERRDNGDLLLRDLSSVNGVFAGGRRIHDETVIRDKVRFGVGPFLFTLLGGVIYSLDSSRSLRLEAHGLQKVVLAHDGGGRVALLHGVDLVVEPGEFVALLGPSGSGKSTLMDCLNGRRRATGGRVLANGEDFYQHYDSFRQSLGYVPQKDIVHTQLTVARALEYTARLRLPTDTDPQELRSRVEEVLDEMELAPHRHKLVANLSGGQVKRVSLGADLLSRPCMLYVDEATSGLDAGTESRMMELFRKLADQGKSIVCITHNVDNVDRCDLVLILARGRVAYFGPPERALGYFGVSRLGLIYDALEGPHARKTPEEWEQQFLTADEFAQYVKARQAKPAEEGDRPLPTPVPAQPVVVGGAGQAVGLVPSDSPRRADRFRQVTGLALQARDWLRPLGDQFRQFWVLTRRYMDITLRDRRNVRLLLMQAPIVAVVLLLGFVGKPFDQEAPRLRHLNEEETRLLEVLAQFSDPDGPALPAGVRKKVEITYSNGGKQEKLVTYPEAVELAEMAGSGKAAANGFEVKEVVLKGDPDRNEPDVSLTNVLRDLESKRIAQALLDANRNGMPVVPEERKMLDPRYSFALLYILSIVVLWFGCNNSAKEIVKEEAIYGRERGVNLGIAPYLASKFLVQSAITALQALTLMTVVYGSLHLYEAAAARYHPEWDVHAPAFYVLPFWPQFGVMVVLSMTGVAMGLLLSASVSNPDQANALLPYVLIPQIVLGGGILPIKAPSVLYWVAVFASPVYWSYRATHVNAGALPSYSGYHTDYEDSQLWPCLAMAAQTAVMLALTAWSLRRKDPDKA